MSKIIVDYGKCDLCGLCVEYCPTHVFYISGNKLVVDEEKCVECYACIPLCPRKALKIGEPDP
jgi:NAD-dependent dihydropyrimidine dehydrogenase PreA subunit